MLAGVSLPRWRSVHSPRHQRDGQDAPPAGQGALRPPSPCGQIGVKPRRLLSMIYAKSRYEGKLDLLPSKRIFLFEQKVQ